MENEAPTFEKQTNSFKLSKMSKGYNWEIKCFDDDADALKKKVKSMDDWAVQEWGVIEC